MCEDGKWEQQQQHSVYLTTRGTYWQIAWQAGSFNISVVVKFRLDLFSPPTLSIPAAGMLGWIVITCLWPLLGGGGGRGALEAGPKVLAVWTPLKLVSCVLQ